MPNTIFLLADSALELVPKELINDEIIIKNAKKRKKNSSSILLDSSLHYKAMYKIKDSEKRGRPDIVHISLLSIIGAPLIKDEKESVKIYIHTYNGEILEVNPETRIPKNYNRFIGLMEQLFTNKIISSKGKILLQVKNVSLEDLIKEIPMVNRMLFTSKGDLINLPKYFEKFVDNDLLLIIGAFPHGYYSEKIQKLSENKISIYPSSLDAWIVLNRIIFSRELSRVNLQ